MKRVKILLSAVLVLAVVGGSLAFTAKMKSSFCIYDRTSTTCTLRDGQIFDVTTDPNVNAITVHTVSELNDCEATAGLPETKATSQCGTVSIKTISE